MMLRAYYDLATSPPTYDFISFLVSAEAERLKRKLETIELHIMPGSKQGFREDKLPPFTHEERVNFRNDVVINGAKLLPSVTSVVLHPDRHEKPSSGYGFGERLFGLKYMMQAAKQGIFPLRAPLAADVPPEHGFVTITLRECDYWTSRNSNLDHWCETARLIEMAGYRVRFIRDTRFAAEAVGPYPVLPDAAKSIIARAGWYASSRLNLFVNNGPAWMCFFMDAPMLVTKMVSNEQMCSREDHFRRYGLEPGTQFPNSGNHRQILWTDDSPDMVAPAALEMLRAT